MNFSYATVMQGKSTDAANTLMLGLTFRNDTSKSQPKKKPAKRKSKKKVQAQSDSGLKIIKVTKSQKLFVVRLTEEDELEKGDRVFGLKMIKGRKRKVVIGEVLKTKSKIAIIKVIKKAKRIKITKDLIIEAEDF